MSSTPLQDDNTSFITISGNEKEPVYFVLERNGENIASTTYVFDYKSNIVNGTIEKPYVIRFTNLDEKVSVYPSVFSKDVNISVSGLPGQDVTVSVISMTGETIYVKRLISDYDGKALLIWNGESCAQGVYLIQVNVNGEKTVRKVIKK